TEFDPAKAGQSMWYRNEYKKDENGDFVRNEEGAKIAESKVATTTYSEAEDYLVGDVLPDVYGGFGTGLTYKGFDVSVDFQYQLGGKVYDSTYAGLMGVNNGYGMHKDLLNAWSTSNTGSDIPRYNYGDTRMNSSSDRFLENANYLSLQNITLGYTLPAGLLSKLQISKVRVYAVADNIWVWSARRGLDPRQSITGGASQAYYSSIRSISAGVNVTF
ncbi:MAG: SusC/RagA family protein, partial [Bacteroidaceae bacterium]|nr:SusC/RagA family protein [Bacteroidaceae bacterium]